MALYHTRYYSILPLRNIPLNGSLWSPLHTSHKTGMDQYHSIRFCGLEITLPININSEHIAEIENVYIKIQI